MKTSSFLNFSSFRAKLILPFCLIITYSCNNSKEKQKELKVIEIESEHKVSLSQVSKLLEEQAELHNVDVQNWKDYSYKPQVSFRIAHANNQIWLKYYVTEDNILAETKEINGNVYEDSCVEFFFDPLANGKYYNFEFSCIGIPHIAYGPNNKEREFVNKEKISKEIKANSSLGSKTFAEKTGGHSWQMTMIIPASILVEDEGITLKGLKSKANFYKCGDKTSEPHYLSWNAIGTKKPNFHKPEYFGTLVFE